MMNKWHCMTPTRSWEWVIFLIDHEEELLICMLCGENTRWIGWRAMVYIMMRMHEWCNKDLLPGFTPLVTNYPLYDPISTPFHHQKPPYRFGSEKWQSIFWFLNTRWLTSRGSLDTRERESYITNTATILKQRIRMNLIKRDRAYQSTSGNNTSLLVINQNRGQQ